MKSPTRWPSPMVYAHRGASLELPENTVPAFERALALGADAIETDAHLTRDGVVVLSHDPSGQRMAGVPVAIAKTDLRDVQRWDAGAQFVSPEGARPFQRKGFVIPTLDEVLRTFPTTRFNVDAKLAGTEMVHALVKLLRAHQAWDRVRIASFHARSLLEVRRLGWEGETGMSSPEVLLGVALGRWVRPAMRVLGNAAQIPTHVGRLRLDSPKVMARLHATGVRIDYWTINDPEEAKRLLAQGADGVMTDDPARIIPAVRGAAS